MEILRKSLYNNKMLSKQMKTVFIFRQKARQNQREKKKERKRKKERENDYEENFVVIDISYDGIGYGGV